MRASAQSASQSWTELFGGETGDEIDKFARCEWFPGPDGIPILSDRRRG